MNNQDRIYERKRRFLRYYLKDNRTGVLIPDTPAARNKALENGALFFSTLSSCRGFLPGLPAPRKWGDLHLQCAVSSEEFDSLKDALSTFFHTKMGLGGLGCLSVVPEGKHGIRIIVPARILGLEGGHPLLAEIYEFVSEEASTWLKRCGFDHAVTSARGYEVGQLAETLSYPQFTAMGLGDFMKRNWPDENDPGHDDNPSPPLPNNLSLLKGGKRIWEGKLFNTFCNKCEFLNHFVSGVPTMTDLECLDGILDVPQPVKKRFLISALKNMGGSPGEPIPSATAATHCEHLKSRGRCSKDGCTHHSPGELIVRWPQFSPFEPIRNAVDDDILKCAIAIIQKMENRGIKEFQARDALRLIRGTFPTMDEVERGLDLLEARGFIVFADMPDYAHVGRRPSPWYLINPRARGHLFHQSTG